MKRVIPLFLGAALSAGAAYGHGDAGNDPRAAASVPGNAEQYAFGTAGDPRAVARTITIDMSDAMRFTPPAIDIARGETVRFVVRNQGKLMHEMVIGTMAELKAHGEAMKKNPEMEHDDPYGAHVAPSRRGEIVWHFNRPGEFHFACLIPGHFDAGMIGRISVR